MEFTANIESVEMVDQLFADFPKAKTTFDELNETRSAEYSKFMASILKSNQGRRRFTKPFGAIE